AHVVVGELAEDEVRRHAAARTVARAVGVGAAPPRRPAAHVHGRGAGRLADRLAGRHAGRLLAAEPHRRADAVLVVARVLELLALLDDDRRPERAVDRIVV